MNVVFISRLKLFCGNSLSRNIEKKNNSGNPVFRIYDDMLLCLRNLVIVMGNIDPLKLG